MKIKSLIEILEKLPQDKDIYIIDERAFSTNEVMYLSSAEGVFVKITPDISVARLNIEVLIK